MSRGGAALLVLLPALLVGAAASSRFASPAPGEADQPLALVEVRSWIVAGQGRHMYARITAPPGHEALSTVVEYTGAFARRGYLPPADPALRDRIVKVARGDRVGPFLAIPMDHRLEAVYWIPLDRARELQRDRAFTGRYFLLGPNSSSGLRAAFESAGLCLPAAVRASGGALGEFPGVELSPGGELAPERWADFGFRVGPEAAP